MTYKSVGVAKHGVSVEVTTATGGFTDTTTIASIGGPLTYSVLPGGGAPEPEHDGNDPQNPWYIDYFGYVASEGTPPGAEPSQRGATMVALDQLDGTTYDWHIDGPAVKTATSTDTACTVYACAGSTRGGIRVRVSYSFVDPLGPSLSGSADGDSLETPPPGEVTPRPTYYSFTSHFPSVVVKLTPVVYKHEEGDVYPGQKGWTYQDCFDHQLRDQNGEGQPGVWIAERFPTAPAQIAAWNNAWGQNLPFENMESNGLTWTTTMGAASELQGQFDNLDRIGLEEIIGNADHPNPGVYGPLVITQHYYAATRSTRLGTWGLLVRIWTNSQSLTAVTHE